ncbi:MAG: amidohydrolase family protein [Steroidobacteraceae bacterium]
MATPMPIVDCDTHWAEPPDLWTSRAPRKYAGKVFEVKTKSDNTEGWFVAGQQVAMIGPSVVAKDMSKYLHQYTVPRFDMMAPATSKPAAAVEYMDERGIAAHVVYPNVIGFGGQALMKTFPGDSDLRLWHVQTYNDALVDLQRESNRRLLPQAALPLWDIEATIAELHRIRKLGLTGIAMSSKPGDFGQPRLLDPVWDRFWATCQDLNIPVNFHIGSGSFEGEIDKFWDPNRQGIYEDGSLNGPLCIFTACSNFLVNVQDVMNLLLTGLLEKYRGLRFVSVESGCGWAPFILQCLEHQWKEMMTPNQLARFSRTPKEMFKDQIYVCLYLEDHRCIDPYIDYFGADNLLFETDFPHPTSMYPHAGSEYQSTRAYADAIFRNQSEQNKAKVLYQNAEKLYGFKVAR